MNENHSFDPARSAAIRQMLVRTVAKNASPAPRERTRRFAVIVSLTVAALVLAGGSTAWALGVRPFPVTPPKPTPTYTPAPTQTPTPTPTPTPAPVEHFDAPSTRVGIGCTALGAGSLASVFPNPELNTRVSSAASYVLPSVVPLRETGYEECEWFSGGQTLDLDISTEVAAGRADIASDHTRGYASLSIGDVSSQHCSTISTTTYDCSISVVVGNYWMIVNYDATGTGQAAVSPNMKQFFATTANRLRAAPLVGKPWLAPATSWSSTTCSDLQTSEPMSTILGIPGLSGPTAPARKNINGIYFTAPRYIQCLWNPTSGSVALDVTIDAGARWVYPLVANGGEPAEVIGADAAETHCYGTEEGYECQLDVLSDNSWLELGLDGGYTANATPQKNQLIRAAQAIIAAHR